MKEEILKQNEILSKLDIILKTLNEGGIGKVYYNTKELCEHLKVGKSVIDKLRQSGELSYHKVGQTYVFDQKDVEDFMNRNKIRMV